MINRLLVANRGEIACRIIQTAHRMGIRVVAVYSDADANARHVAMADEAFHIGPAPSSESYLRAEKIIEIAKKSGAQAVHPGYGFLSENTAFAEACEANNIVFIGPPSSAIAAMGSKSAAKAIMEEAGVPLVPGYHGDDQSVETLRAEAEKCGFPLLLKAVAGGGGKGMRVVNSMGEFDDALAAAKREAQNAFGNPDMLIERYLTQPRHVEIQVFCDQDGKGVFLAERDCSVQRRHQKIVEESPSLFLDNNIRKKMADAAVTAAKTVKYTGAGTVEFIMGEDSRFYFMEMNTRLQVEHPITEMVTGSDLVQLQIRVAQGEKLSFKQEDIIQNGHAIEVRLYAEDPDRDFMPSVGTLEVVGESRLLGVRLDTGYQAGNEGTVSFDPMLAKLIVWGQNRDLAISKMDLALSDHPFLGLTTNRDYVKRILKHPKFIEGETFTHFVNTYKKDLEVTELSEDEMALGLLAYEFFGSKGAKGSAASRGDQGGGVVETAWDSLSGFRLN